MKSFLRTGIGGLLLLTSLTVAGYSFYQLMRTGNCSSGGVYVSKRECPAGTTRWAFALPISAITGMLSTFLLAAGLRGGALNPFAQAREITGRLEHLQALLVSGALTPAEFEQATQRILDEL